MERILLALVDGRTPPNGDVDVLNRAIKSVMSDRCFVPAGDGYAWGWDDGNDLGRMLRPVLFSVANVLTSKLRKVRRCAGEDCDLLFVDRTAGSPRGMEACGRRVKARKHYLTKVKPERDQAKARARADRPTLGGTA